MYTYAYLHVTTRKSSTVTILLVTTRKFECPTCNSWPLIGRLTHYLMIENCQWELKLYFLHPGVRFKKSSNRVGVLVCVFVSSNVVVDYRFLFSEPLIPGFGTRIIFVPIFGTCIFFVPVFGTCTTFFPTFGTHFRLSELFVPKIGINRYLGSERRKNPTTVAQ